MKRVILVLLSVVLMLGVLCSCSTNDKAADDSVQTTTSSHHSGHHAEPGEPNNRHRCSPPTYMKPLRKRFLGGLFLLFSEKEYMLEGCRLG